MKNIDHSGMDRANKEYLETAEQESLLNKRGINCDELIEGIPEFIQAPCEKVYHGKNDVRIVLGRDRPGHRSSGYGGKGDTKAGSIDIVIGSLGYKGREVNESGDKVFVEPDFELDAVRFYGSQKSDVDDYFGLVEGSIGSMRGVSAIGLKADAVRVVSRDGGIKLVTGVDKKNSRGEDNNILRGIDLVAGNDDSSLQPMVKGENLVELLGKTIDYVEKLGSVVDGLLVEQTKLNRSIASHTHFSPFFGQKTTPSEVLMLDGAKTVATHIAKTNQSLISLRINLAKLKQTYLSQAGSRYVSSRWNNVN